MLYLNRSVFSYYTYADNVALLAFACGTPVLLLLRAHAGTDTQTNGRTPDRCLDPALHTMWSVPINYIRLKVKNTTRRLKCGHKKIGQQ